MGYPTTFIDTRDIGLNPYPCTEESTNQNWGTLAKVIPVIQGMMPGGFSPSTGATGTMLPLVMGYDATTTQVLIQDMGVLQWGAGGGGSTWDCTKTFQCLASSAGGNGNFAIQVAAGVASCQAFTPMVTTSLESYTGYVGTDNLIFTNAGGTPGVLGWNDLASLLNSLFGSPADGPYVITFTGGVPTLTAYNPVISVQYDTSTHVLSYTTFDTIVHTVDRAVTC